MKKRSIPKILLSLALGIITIAGCRQDAKNTSYRQNRLSSDNTHHIMFGHADTLVLHSMVNKCYLLQKEGNDKAAIDCYEDALNASREKNYAELSAIICRNLVNSCFRDREFERANYYSTQFRNELENIPSPFFNSRNSRHQWLLGKKQIHKAVLFYNSGNFDTAVRLYLKIINAVGPVDSLNRSLMSQAYAALGAMYSQIGNKERAFLYFEKIADLGRNFSDTFLMLTSLHNKAVTWSNYNYSDKALSTAKEALKMVQSIDEITYGLDGIKKQSELTGIIAIALIQQKQPKEALIYSKMRLQTAHDINSIIQAHTLLGYNYNQLKDYKKARSYLLSGLQMRSAPGNYNWTDIENAYNQLGEAYEGLGQYDKALQYKKRYFKIRDSIRGSENAKRIAHAEVRYRVAQKDKDLAQKDKVLAENKTALYQQRNWIWRIAGFSLLLLLSFAAFTRNHRQKRRLLQKQLQNLEQQKKIEQLQVKMDTEEEERKRLARELHDGLGVLLSAAKINHAVLGKLMPMSGNANTAYMESAEILQQMQQEVKTITNNLIPYYISHKNFNDAVEGLLSRFDKQGLFHIQLHTYGMVQDMHPDRSFSLFRVIEEIIHNAVKHSEGSEIIVQLMYHSYQLNITIEDNGIGFDTERDYPGMGLQNISNRLEQLNGHLNLASFKNQGTIYTLEIPYRFSKNIPDNEQTDSLNR